tara:strand:+ start:983 stop:1888 length:906 start_codon:yes stop_codon:yes gene_type:complete
MALYVGPANSSNKFQGNSSSDPSSSLAEGDIFYNSTDNVYKWYNGSEWKTMAAVGADGSQLSPFTTMAEMSQAAAPDGSYYVQLSGMSSATQTYVKKLNGVYYVLAAIVTNSDGDTADWFQGDTTKGGTVSGTNYFTTDSTLRTSSMQNETTKDNAKNEIFNTVSFNKLMIKEDHNGTIGFKAYTLNASKKFGGASGTRWFSTTSGQGATSDVVQSMTYSTGTQYAYTSSNLYFDYQTNNDGGRLIPSPPSNEASGGWSTRVDGHSGYYWKGNLTKNSGRQFNSDGTTTDHTAWMFINNGT